MLTLLMLIIKICIITITAGASGCYCLASFALVSKINQLSDTKLHQ